MGRFEMQLTTGRVTGGAAQDRFEVLFLGVALSARKSHGSVCRTDVTRGAFLFYSSSPPVTLVATELRMFSL